MTSSLPSLMDKYPRQARPTRTNAPTTSSSFARSMSAPLADVCHHVIQTDGPTGCNEFSNLSIRGPDEIRSGGHGRNLPFQQHGDPIGNPEYFRNLVTHHHGGKAELLLRHHDQIMNRLG